jgi:hypothetical protein
MTTDQWNQAVIKTVREHARKHYNTGGWDYVVESFSDAEIIKYTHGCATLDSAIEAIGKIVGELEDYRRDVEGL